MSNDYITRGWAKLPGYVKSLEDERDKLRAELASVRADFSALQHAIVGDTGVSAILTVEKLRADLDAAKEHEARPMVSNQVTEDFRHFFKRVIAVIPFENYREIGELGGAILEQLKTAPPEILTGYPTPSKRGTPVQQTPRSQQAARNHRARTLRKYRLRPRVRH